MEQLCDVTIAQDLQPFRIGDGKMVPSTNSVCWWWKSRLASSGVFELFCSTLILNSYSLSFALPQHLLPVPDLSMKSCM